MLNYIFVPAKGDIEIREFNSAAIEMFDIADKEVGKMHLDFTCFDHPDFCIIANDNDVSDEIENKRINKFTNRGKFFGNCILIKTSPTYKSRSDYSGTSFISEEEFKNILNILEGNAAINNEIS